MSSVQNLRALINQRLTAAAEEIFREFEKTVVQYEEEIDRQRRLLDITWKPADLPQQHVHEENGEHPQMKKEQEELCTSREGEHLVLMREADMLVECKSKCEEISKEMFQLNEDTERHRNLLDILWKPRIRLHRIDHPQQHVCEEKDLTDQQLCNQERNFSLDQEDSEPSLIKEEQEELCTNLDQENSKLPQTKAEQEVLCTSQDQNDPDPLQFKEEQQELYTSQQGEQIILKKATNIFLLTSTDEDSDHSEPEPNSDQLLSCISPVAESPHQEGSKDVDSTRIAALQPKKSQCTNSSHSNNVDNLSLSEGHCDTDTDTDTATTCVKCDVCRKTFKDEYQMKKHLQIHEGVKPCGKSFSFSSQLKVHMMKHKSKKEFSCKTCGKIFSHNSHMIVHMRTHTGEKPYSCRICGKCFNNGGHLTVHLRTHTGEKPYSCGICGKRFNNGSHLTVHMRTHTGEKPFSCKTCGKSFSQSGALTKHLVTHTGEKPYSCETCGKSFSHRCSLTQHQNSH